MGAGPLDTWGREAGRHARATSLHARGDAGLPAKCRA